MNPIYLTWESYYTAVVQDYQLACKLVEADWDEGYRLLSAHSFFGLTTKPVFRDKTMQIQDKENSLKKKMLLMLGWLIRSSLMRHLRRNFFVQFPILMSNVMDC
jgi:hypothetical protein